MEAGPVIYTYNVSIQHYPEMAVRYWLEKWSEAWEVQEWIKNHKEAIPDA